MYGNARKEREKKERGLKREDRVHNRFHSLRVGECMVSLKERIREKKERGRKRRDRVEQVSRAGECMVMQVRRERKKKEGGRGETELNRFRGQENVW